jgi:hypothetical protein
MMNRTKTLDERIAELEPSGATGPAIHKTLTDERYDVSLSSVGRALRKLRGSQRVGRRVAEPSKEPATPPPLAAPVLGDATDPKTLDGLLSVAARALHLAEARGDLAALARFGSLATAIFEAKRKAEPPEEKPEGYFVTLDQMKAAAEQGRERLFTLFDRLAAEAEATWERCATCGHLIDPHQDEAKGAST